MRNLEIAEQDAQCAVNLLHVVNNKVKTEKELHAYLVNVRSYLEHAQYQVEEALKTNKATR